MKRYFRENIKALSPYSTARDEYQGDLGVYLDANENPYDNGYNRYPDPYQKAIKQRIGVLKGVAPERIFIGNGSDEAIDLVFRIFCQPRVHNAVILAPTYGMYRVAAQINDVEMREVRLAADFGLDADKVLAATDSNTRLVFLCSPNNPSGNSLDRQQVVRIIERFNGIVVLDEAYADFAADGGLLSELKKWPNLVILQTLSKAWGLAGLRLGLAFAAAEVIEAMTRVKYPYNIGVQTQKIILEELDKVYERSAQIETILSQRERVTRELSAMPVVLKVFPSDANFILVEVENPRGIYENLIKEGVIVRDRSKIPGCEGCLRITIGTPVENDKLIGLFQNFAR